ncbi:unnamed protein product [Ceratitis capitata]|uniref:(Mediterranean fruit fly) hypothetical protein n=1 Tax=Ceratitis capitata TaxID=7213 RepID=A0A811ULZ4_CERCA|nr:unnamed protein product [Ceratitis capitata]
MLLRVVSSRGGVVLDKLRRSMSFSAFRRSQELFPSRSQWVFWQMTCSYVLIHAHPIPDVWTVTRGFMRDQPCMPSKGFPCPSTNDYRFRDYSAFDNKPVYRRIKGELFLLDKKQKARQSSNALFSDCSKRKNLRPYFLFECSLRDAKIRLISGQFGLMRVVYCEQLDKWNHP